MTKGRKRFIIVGSAVVVLAAIVIGNLRPKKESKGPEVRTEEIERRKIEAWVRAPGRIEPVTKVQVSSNVMGRVAEVAVVEGQRVRSGDLLLRLDDERYRSNVQQYRAQISSGEANADLAEAENREAQLNLERMQKIAEGGLASDQELISVRTRAEVAAARLVSAREEIRRARAALDQAEKDLRETVFTASIDGIVTELNVEVGENVITGTMNNPGTVILTLADLSAMEVESEVDETDVVAITVGQTARIFVDALPDTVLSGEVTRVGQSGRGGSGGQQEGTNFEVAVLIESPPACLRSGMNVDVEILTGTREDALAIPLQALTARPAGVVAQWERKREEGEDAVAEDEDAIADTTTSSHRNLVEGLFLFEDEKARFVPVDLGLRGETHVEVFGEIDAGQTLITGPYKTLRQLKDAANVRLDKKGRKKEEKETSESSES